MRRFIPSRSRQMMQSLLFQQVVSNHVMDQLVCPFGTKLLLGLTSPPPRAKPHPQAGTRHPPLAAEAAGLTSPAAAVASVARAKRSRRPSAPLFQQVVSNHVMDQFVCPFGTDLLENADPISPYSVYAEVEFFRYFFKGLSFTEDAHHLKFAVG